MSEVCCAKCGQASCLCSDLSALTFTAPDYDAMRTKLDALTTERDALRAALRGVLAAEPHWHEGTRLIVYSDSGAEAFEAARQALAGQPEPERGEPTMSESDGPVWPSGALGPCDY